MNKYLITNLDSTALSFPRILASYNVYLARSDLPSSTAPQKPVNVSTRKTEIISNNAAALVDCSSRQYPGKQLPDHSIWGRKDDITESAVYSRYPIFILLFPSRTRFMGIISENDAGPIYLCNGCCVGRGGG